MIRKDKVGNYFIKGSIGVDLIEYSIEAIDLGGWIFLIKEKRQRQ